MPTWSAYRLKLAYQYRMPGEEEFSYERYATERKGFWLKTSLSMNRFSRSQDIGVSPGPRGIEDGRLEA